MEHNSTRSPLMEDQEEKDLGVRILFYKNLKFRKHVGAICNKANRMIGLVRRTFKYMDKEIFLTVYKSMIRDVIQIEKIQRRATKIQRNIKDLPYPDRMRYLKIPSLTFRRLRSDMIQTFKILKGLDDIDPTTLFKLEKTRNTRGHSLKLCKAGNRTNQRNHFFTQRVVNPWNSLPQNCIDAETINSFKTRLEKHWTDHPLSYNPPG